ncbi:hypothetical protein KDW41_18500 [Burkholderia vietnamiensis]|nr:hypothetical protein [Burkholderia vietnamiensis]
MTYHRKMSINVSRTPGPTALDTGLQAAVSRFIQAGNCSEHGYLSAFLVSQAMKPDEWVRIMSDANADHTWSTLSRQAKPAADDVVLDAWAEGPAVFAEDSRMTQPQNATDFGELDYAEAKLAKEVCDGIEAHLIQTTSPDKELQEWIKSGWTMRFAQWDPEPVLDKSKGRTILTSLGAPKTLAPTLKSDDRKVELSKEVLAAGVARNLGATVSEAAKVAPKIIDEAFRLVSDN